ncbi:D-glycerate dehydrogenase [bacterium]|nr:D-glycerate dehydrogenase [bacterium]
MKVFVTRRIPKKGISLLAEKFEMEIYDSDDPIPYDELLKGVKGSVGLLSLLSDKVDKNVMDAAPALKVIANYAVGYNNIDIEEATKRKIHVTNTPEVLTETTADLVWALILSVSRRIVEADKFMRKREFKGWAPNLFLGEDVYWQTLGILGMGKIGSAVAKRAKGFGMNIIYHDPQHKPYYEEETSAELVSFEELLTTSDFLSLNLPLTKENRHIISYKELDMMKRTAYLINTARGPIVDEKGLVQALKEGKIKGAGLDVYEDEPKVEEELLSMENVVLLPHIGSATGATRDKMAIMAAQSIVDVLSGRRPKHTVNMGK